MTIPRNALSVSFIAAILGSSSAFAGSFYSISGVTSDTASTDLFSASQLIQGPGTGFSTTAPFNQLSAALNTRTWVTNAPNGGFGDYFGPTPSPAPRLVFDLGANRALTEISLWNYAPNNRNGMSQASLRFATAADGVGGFGTSVTYNPTVNVAFDQTPRQSFDFAAPLVARYVELTPEDNFFGVAVAPAGGDRVGLGEVAFEDKRFVVTPSGVVSSGGGGPDFFSAGQLIDGSGLSDPAPDITNILDVTHSGTNPSNSWVTQAPNGSGDFYNNNTPDPVLTFELDRIYQLTEMVSWNYLFVGNAAETFDVEFIIDDVVVDSLTGLTFDPSSTTAGLISFGDIYAADTVRITITDNYESLGPGGDRVGLNEVRFIATIPEPTSLIVGLVGIGGLAMRRRRG